MNSYCDNLFAKENPTRICTIFACVPFRTSKFYWAIFIFTLRQIQYYRSVFVVVISSELIIKIYKYKRTTTKKKPTFISHVFRRRTTFVSQICQPSSKQRLSYFSPGLEKKYIFFVVIHSIDPWDLFRPSYVNNINASSGKIFSFRRKFFPERTRSGIIACFVTLETASNFPKVFIVFDYERYEFFPSRDILLYSAKRLNNFPYWRFCVPKCNARFVEPYVWYSVTRLWINLRFSGDKFEISDEKLVPW